MESHNSASSKAGSCGDVSSKEIKICMEIQKNGEIVHKFKESLTSVEDAGKMAETKQPYFDPSGRCNKVLVLILLCCLSFGEYFCYDNPVPLADIMQKEYKLSNSQFQLFYSFYSWPNVFFCFLGGFLIDRVFGIRRGTIIFATLMLFGQLCFAIGGLLSVFWLMLFGRFCFGIGAQGTLIACDKYTIIWFKTEQLNMVFGLEMALAKLAYSANFWVVWPIYQWVANTYHPSSAVGITFIIGSVTCLFSLIAAIVLGILDKRAEKILDRPKADKERIALSDMKKFRIEFWGIAVAITFYYIAVDPFVSVAKNFFMTVHKMDGAASNQITSIIFLLSALTCPLFGYLADKTGRNVIWVLAAIIGTGLAHVFLCFDEITPYVGMVILGSAFSLATSVIWTLIAYVVPEQYLGTAYGICYSLESLGLSTTALIIGKLADLYGFVTVEIYFICSTILAVIAIIVTWIMNSRKDKVLNMSSVQRKEFGEKEEGKEGSNEKSKESSKLSINGECKENYKVGRNDQSREDTKVDIKEGIKLESKEDSKVESLEDSKLESQEDSKVENQEDGKVESKENSKVGDKDNSKVEDKEDSKVESEDDSQVESEKGSKESIKVQSSEDSNTESEKGAA